MTEVNVYPWVNSQLDPQVGSPSPIVYPGSQMDCLNQADLEKSLRRDAAKRFCVILEN